MAFTPSRMGNPSLRLTPRASPYYQSPSTRSPIKQAREEQCLSLKKVIGTTSSSLNSFDCLDKHKTFAYVAGAAVVLAKLDDDHNIEQRFFRAKPSISAVNPTAPVYNSPTPTPTASSPRGRFGSSFRDGSTGPGSFGSSLNDATDHLGSRQGHTRDRMKAASCISLSPDGKLLAVGETGHKPRVLIFSTSGESSADVPLSAISEHAFGVQCIAFSRDSRYLATLGDMNDGFLYVWRVNRTSGAVSLHASNRCTSNVRQIFWIGESLLTIGTRHVKIWRVDRNNGQSPSKRVSENPSGPASPSRALSGRNCLLGALLDKTFAAGVAISQSQAIVCSEDGSVCLMDDNDSSPAFYKVSEAGFGVSAVTWHPKASIFVAGEHGEIRHFAIQKLLEVTPTSVQLAPTEERSFRPVSENAHTVALATIGNHFLSLDSERGIHVLELEIDDDNTLCGCSIARRIPGHKTAVLGVQAVAATSIDEAAFLTYSADGSVNIWSSQGVCLREYTVPLTPNSRRWDSPANELTAVRALIGLGQLVSGDKLGRLRLADFKSGSTLFETNGHANEVTDIAVCRRAGTQWVATSGRDRMIQIYSPNNEELELSQTLDEHVGAVTSIAFSTDGETLISSSSDRSVIIRKCCSAEVDGTSKAAYIMVRSISLKVTPLSINLSKDTRCEVTVCTIDKQISRYSLDTGNLIGAFRAADHDDGDAVIINSAIRFTANPNGTYIAGLSSTDKSLRVYTKSGKLVGREYGHTEGMTGLVLLENRETMDSRSLVTVATDGTVFIWSIQCGIDPLNDTMESLSVSNQVSPAPESDIPTRPPLRKVISTSELSQIRRSGEDDGILPLPARARSRSPHRQRTGRLSTIPANNFDPSAFDSSHRRQTYSLSSNSSIAEPNARRVSQAPPSSSDLPQSNDISTRNAIKPRSRQSSAHPRRRSTSASSSPNHSSGQKESRQMSVTELCLGLHALRKKLSTSANALSLDEKTSLEHELSSTLRVLNNDTSKSGTSNGTNGRRLSKIREHDTAMTSLLDAHADRLLHTIESKIQGCVSSEVDKRLGSDTVAGSKK